jgi:hypothetical protein
MIMVLLKILEIAELCGDIDPSASLTNIDSWRVYLWTVSNECHKTDQINLSRLIITYSLIKNLPALIVMVFEGCDFVETCKVS